MTWWKEAYLKRIKLPGMPICFCPFPYLAPSGWWGYDIMSLKDSRSVVKPPLEVGGGMEVCVFGGGGG